MHIFQNKNKLAPTSARETEAASQAWCGLARTMKAIADYLVPMDDCRQCKALGRVRPAGIPDDGTQGAEYES